MWFITVKWQENNRDSFQYGSQSTMMLCHDSKRKQDLQHLAEWSLCSHEWSHRSWITSRFDPRNQFYCMSSLQFECDWLQAHEGSSKAKTTKSMQSFSHKHLTFLPLYSLKIFLLYVRSPWVVTNHFPILINITYLFKEKKIMLIIGFFFNPEF